MIPVALSVCFRTLADGAWRRHFAGLAGSRGPATDRCAEAIAGGHEVALHSWDHRPYNRMTADEQRVGHGTNEET